MDNWLVKVVANVDSLHVEIENHKFILVGFCFIGSIDRFLIVSCYYYTIATWLYYDFIPFYNILIEYILTQCQLQIYVSYCFCIRGKAKNKIAGKIRIHRNFSWWTRKSKSGHQGATRRRHDSTEQPGWRLLAPAPLPPVPSRAAPLPIYCPQKSKTRGGDYSEKYNTESMLTRKWI